MKRLLLAGVFALLATPVLAQSTAQPVLPGLLVSSGCPAGSTVCYVPYSNTNPLPVSATITPSGTQDTNLKQVNGATVNVGAGAAGTGTQRITTSTDSTIGVENLPTTVDTNAGAVGASTIRIAQGTGTSTDASSTVTLGGTYQTVFASSASRKGCLIQNPSTATEVLSIKVGTMASPLTIPAGAAFSCVAGSFVVSDAITVTAATTSHAFVAVSQ